MVGLVRKAVEGRRTEATGKGNGGESNGNKELKKSRGEGRAHLKCGEGKGVYLTRRTLVTKKRTAGCWE